MNITTDVSDGIAQVRFDDGKMNVMTRDAALELDAALAHAEAQASAIVLAGRTGAFCAGFDKAVMIGADAEARDALALSGAAIAKRLFNCPKPVVAACEGHAFTIGALWLMAADTRIGERGAFKYAMTETVMGARLSGWPLVVLESRVPPRLMTPIAVQSLVLGPEDAIDAGYLDQVVEPGEALTAAHAAAVQLAGLPADVYAANKRAIREPFSQRLAAALAA